MSQLQVRIVRPGESSPEPPNTMLATLPNGPHGEKVVGYQEFEVPLYEPLLLRYHPTKFYFVVFADYDIGNNQVRRQLVSCALVDRSAVC